MNTSPAAEDIVRLGYIGVKPLESGEWAGLQKMLFTTGLFVITADGSAWRTRYCYEDWLDAALALAEWDGRGDPPGNWIKQKPEGRLGPGALPS